MGAALTGIPAERDHSIDSSRLIGGRPYEEPGSRSEEQHQDDDDDRHHPATLGRGHAR
jgi:hypothetical protein